MRRPDFSPKEYLNKAKDFVIDNYRYFLAGLVFIIIMVVLFACTGPKASKPVDPMAGAYQDFTVNTNEELKELIDGYYSAYAMGDTMYIEGIAQPVSDQELSYIEFYSQYIDSIEAVKLYTKRGYTPGSYMVSAYVEFKYAGIDTKACGLDFLYVEPDELNELVINNLYGGFNQANGLYDMDPNVTTLIAAFEQQDDVIELQSQVQQAFNEAMEADADLNEFITYGLPEATLNWNTQYQIALAQAETEREAIEAQAEKEAAAAAEAEEKAALDAQLEANAYMGTVNGSDINVRAKADTTSKSIGKLKKGDRIKIYAREGEFYKVEYNGEKVYVAAKFITPDEGHEDATTTETTTTTQNTGAALTEGTKITLNDSIKLRKGMGTDTDAITTLHPGDQITVIMSYSEGWTKVKFGNKEGYVKTDLIQ